MLKVLIQIHQILKLVEKVIHIFFVWYCFIARLEISADRNFWLAKVAEHEWKKFGQFGILGLEIARADFTWQN